MLKYHFCSLKNSKRLDAFLCEQIPNYSRSFLKKNIKNLLVNNQPKKISQAIFKKDEIYFSLAEIKALPPDPLYHEITTIYEDEYLLILNKPAGLLSHPKNEHIFQNDSIAEYIQDKISKQDWTVPRYRWGIVHRLDRETSGIIICAKTNDVLELMKNQFQKREIGKKYYALVEGNILQGSGEINKPIGKDPRYPMRKKITELGKEALTYYKVIERFEKMTLVDIDLITGRTHQIRVHFSDFNYPVIGDKFYGKTKKMDENLFLCCYNLNFKHPITDENLSFSIPLPKFFEKKLQELRKLNNN